MTLLHIAPPEAAAVDIGPLSSARVWDYENGWHWFSHPSRMHKLLAHHELYRQIVGLPGHVFEFGVFKGASLIRWASFRQLHEAEQSRRIVGFDAFGRFPTDGLSLPADRDFVARFEQAGGDGLPQDTLATLLQRKGFSNIDLVAGNVMQTLPQYLQRHPETRLALLHLDMDVREPTELALQLLWDRVVPGGLLVLDDYGTVAGETEAVDSFLAGRGLRLEKLPHYVVPAFVRKPV